MTSREHTSIAALTVALLVLPALPLPSVAQANSEATRTQSSLESGVTVKATPKAIGPAATRWEFTIALDTHSADLSDDLVADSRLVSDDGRTAKPIGWTGPGPGGHHREGVLAFDALTPRPAWIELRIVRPGEVTARTFKWQL